MKRRLAEHQEDLALCQATIALAMPLKSTCWQKSHCRVPHEAARYGYPPVGADSPHASCPLNHANSSPAWSAITAHAMLLAMASLTPTIRRTWPP